MTIISLHCLPWRLRTCGHSTGVPKQPCARDSNKLSLLQTTPSLHFYLEASLFTQHHSHRLLTFGDLPFHQQSHFVPSLKPLRWASYLTSWCLHVSIYKTRTITPSISSKGVGLNLLTRATCLGKRQHSSASRRSGVPSLGSLTA